MKKTNEMDLIKVCEFDEEKDDIDKLNGEIFKCIT